VNLPLRSPRNTLRPLRLDQVWLQLTSKFGATLLTLLALLPVTSSAQQQRDDEVLRVNTDLVVINTTVLDEQRRFVSALRRSDFKILEDGREQKLATFSAEETPFAVAILLDTSGSMEGRLTLARAAAIRFLDGLRDQDVASVYRFDTKVERLQEFSSGRDLPDLAFGLRASGMTVLNDALLRAANDLAERPEQRRAIIVLSDGGENYSRSSSQKALERALAAGAMIYSVNMSDEAHRDFVGAMILRNFAGKTGGLYIPSPGGQALRDAFAQIVDELGHQYTLGYQSSNRARDGSWRTIEVKLSRAGLTARTRKGYRAPTD
jgi:Ca-activated chloride channel homolog